jgi:hypothetical protein
MRRLLIWLASVAALVATACSSTPPASSTIVNHPDAPSVIEALRFTDLRCTGKIHTFSGPAVANCQPIANEPAAALSAAAYPDAATAEAQFKANCSDPGYYFYRKGENWRAAISTTKPPFPRAKALAIAAALSTDAYYRCGLA